MVAANILVVDDDAGVRQTVCDVLQMAGHHTTEAASGSDAIDLITRESFDLVILDVNLPHTDGFTVLEKIRRRKPQLPIIMLTARDERSDVVHGLKLGADDYIRKPFGIEEFSLRVSAVLRRSGGVATDATLVCGDIELDPVKSVVLHAGELVNLSPTEFRLLDHFMRHPGQVLSKSHLLESVWGIDFDTTSTVVETFISYLRRKLDHKGHEHFITVRGFGIKLEPLQ